MRQNGHTGKHSSLLITDGLLLMQGIRLFLPDSYVKTNLKNKLKIFSLNKDLK